MKLKYQTLSREEKNKIKEDFIKLDSSLVYKKAGKVVTITILGLIVAVIGTTFDIVYTSGLINYIIDGFLFIFSLTFLIVMKNIQLKEINNYVINKNKNKKSKK